MTLDEAAQHIGQPVTYQPHYTEHGEPEDGVITSVTSRYVFVRYGADLHSKATAPDRLQLAGGP